MAGSADATNSPATRPDATLRTGGAPDAPLDRGMFVGRYVVLDVLGSGGMGVVYCAYDPELNRKVALKLMQASADGSSGGQGRMVREAQALARLSHPNVVAVYDVGSLGERVFVAMELVEGTTLGEWAASGKRSWREIVAMFADAGRGLAAAHAAGIVHRDFKPGNVLVGSDGRARVLDFGLARAADDPRGLSSDDIASSPPRDALGETLTQVGAIVGTPVYMPPEAQRGEAVSPQGDQFSFCVALYEALYGVRPFEALLVADELPEIPPPPADSNVPLWLRRVVVRGLAFRPADRFASMDELLAALAADPGRRRRRIAVVAAASLLAVAAGAGGLAWRAHVLAAERAADPCAAAAPLAGKWDDPTRERLHGLFRKRQMPDDSFDRTALALDTIAKRWLDARGHACAETREAHAQPEAVLLLRLSCLDRQTDELGALLALYGDADAASLGQLARAVYRLPAPVTCADPRTLAFFEPPPPHLRDRLAEMHRRFLAARALKLAMKKDDAAAQLAALERDALATGYRPFIAEVAVSRCLMIAGLGDADVHACDEAEQISIAAGLDFQAARVAAHRLQLGALSGRDAATMHDWEARARAWVDRTGDNVAESTLEQSLGAAAMSAGTIEASAAHFRRAYDLRLESGGAESSDTQISSSNLALALSLLGSYDEALVLQEQSIAALERVNGPDTPAIAQPLDNYGFNLVLVGRLREARVALERARKLAGKQQIGAVLCDLARLDLAEGKTDDAIAQCTDGLARIRAFGVSKFNLAINEDPLARAFLAAKRYDDALAQARTCLADFREERHDATIEQVPCMIAEGTALNELGRTAEAAPILDEADRLQHGHHAPQAVLDDLARQIARAHASTTTKP
jgi:tetratricopeptide (TPR) repeat protein/predicted Ser/Thr protein kinase